MPDWGRALLSLIQRMTVALIKDEKLPLPTILIEGTRTMQLEPIVINKGNIDILLQDQFYTKAQLGL